MRRIQAAVFALLAFGCRAAAPPSVGEAPFDPVVPEILARDRIPAAVVLTGDLQGIRYRRAFGAASTDTIFDLASCTKVVATTTAAMMLVEEGKLSLHDRVSRHLPEFEGRDITIEELLAHRSGLPAYLTPKGRGSDAVFDEVVTLKASKTFRYSCLNMISLGRVVERIAGQSLSEFCRKRIFEPLGMRDTGYDPDPGRCAPATPDFVGVVHDPLARAYRSKGSHDPGNAGLFSTADDLGIFCRALLEGRLLRAETVRRMFQPDADTRGLGWDVFDDPPYRPGVGHTGFTGTLIWMDPARGRYAVVLSNRVYHDEKVDVRRLRKEVLSAVNAR